MNDSKTDGSTSLSKPSPHTMVGSVVTRGTARHLSSVTHPSRAVPQRETGDLAGHQELFHPWFGGAVCPDGGEKCGYDAVRGCYPKRSVPLPFTASLISPSRASHTAVCWAHTRADHWPDHDVADESRSKGGQKVEVSQIKIMHVTIPSSNVAVPLHIIGRRRASPREPRR